MAFNTSGEAYAAPAGEQYRQEKAILDLKDEIEKMAMHASAPLNAIHTELPKLSADERRKACEKYPEIFYLEDVGNRAAQTAVQYFFYSEVAKIEGGNNTPAQKLERYQDLHTHFKKIAEETKSAYTEIIGCPLW